MSDEMAKEIEEEEMRARTALEDVNVRRQIKAYIDRRRDHTDSFVELQLKHYPDDQARGRGNFKFALSLSGMVMNSVDRAILEYLEKCQDVLPLISMQLISCAKSLPGNAKSSKASEKEDETPKATSSSRNKKR